MEHSNTGGEITIVVFILAMNAGLLSLLIYNSWKFIIKQWNMRKVEIKVLYAFATLAIILRLCECILFLIPNVTC